MMDPEGARSAAFSLIHNAWIPTVQRAGGPVRWLRPRDVVAGADLPVDVSWGRPDLRIATYELLIGLITVAMAPMSNPAWDRLFGKPPSPESLDAAFTPLAPFFELDGDGPRFLQDFAALAGPALPPDALLIDLQGEDGTFFAKAGRYAVLSRAGAAIALYAFQAFAPAGGRGNRTSMRGGGPLTTLVMPPETTLWQRLWANVPVLGGDEERAPENLALVFPWAALTRTSETNSPTVPRGHAHALQAYFGMPRRARLQFAANADRTPCAITGIIDDVVVTGFVQRPYGPKYEGWVHPLTPYYQPTAGAAEMLPLHPKVTPIGYRQWIGLLYDGDRGAVARSVRLAKDLLPKGRGPVSVVAAGYVTDNMKALDYAESDLPLHILGDKAAQEQLETFAKTLIAAADAIALELRRAIDKAFAADPGSTLTGAASAGFWARTETVFRRSLDQAAGYSAGEAGDEARLMLRQSWRATLEIEALAAFDGAVPLDTIGDLKTAERVAIIQARKALVWMLLGYAKSGAKFLGMLAIPAPAKAKETADV